MRVYPRMLILAAGCAVAVAVATAQQPNPAQTDPLVDRLLAFDKNKDGKLTKDEITDERLLRIFERADANKDGTVTKEELTALAAQEAALGGGGKGGKEGGFEGKGGKGGEGKGGEGKGKGGRGEGKGGPSGFGRVMPQLGQVMPVFLQEMLNLTDAQKKQFEDLQKDVDAKFEKILTEDQRKQLKEMRERGPFGGRGPGGPPEGGLPFPRKKEKE